MPANAAEIWKKTRPLRLPCDGSASQFYSLDVPISGGDLVLDLFAGFFERPDWVGLDDDWSEPRPLRAELRRKLLSHTDKSPTHQLRRVRARREEVSLYLWIDSQSQALDVEFIFGRISCSRSP